MTYTSHKERGPQSVGVLQNGAVYYREDGAPAIVESHTDAIVRFRRAVDGELLRVALEPFMAKYQMEDGE